MSQPTSTEPDQTANVERSSKIGSTIRLLGDLLGETIVSQSGNAVFDLEEEIRALSKSRRSGDSTVNAVLASKVDELVDDLPTTANIVKAFSTYFQLVNLAEEHERVHILRERANQAYLTDTPMDESIFRAVQTLKQEGFDANATQEILQRLFITPVFTAHPTESRRRTIRQNLARISSTLDLLNSTDVLEREKQPLLQQLKSLIVLLWESDDIRRRRLTVMDEVRSTGLYFFESTLFDVVPQIYEELELALRRVFPNSEISVPSLLKFGSWIGGDRDGNPLVTNNVTVEALQAQQDLALERYAADVQDLYELLSVSVNRSSIGDELLVQLEREFALQEIEPDDVVFRFEDEPYRQRLVLMYRRIQATRTANNHAISTDQPDLGYENAEQLVDDLKIIQNSLLENNGPDLAFGPLSRLIRRVEVFGFHLATLDVRQHASRHVAAIAEICSAYGMTSDYADLPEDQKTKLLEKELASDRPFTAQLQFNQSTNDVVATFRTIFEAKKNFGEASMQTYIISMTESPNNVLEVLLLAKDAGLFGAIDIVPLFETVDDLNNASSTMISLFQNPHYQRHLELRGRHQQIMIGYSDSNKDGGYLRANWMLFKAQKRLANVCKESNVQLTLFHGRGGSLGRGGGPANRAILSQPHNSVNGRIRVTEQGEVISSRYSNRSVAKRHLQQLLNAVICSAGKRPNYDKFDLWSEIMDEVSEVAYRKYRDLVEHPKFVEYFHASTPIALVDSLNLGSRPSRRTGNASLDDLRAIPWVFSWTQSRATAPSWFGVGTAISSWRGEDESRLEKLRDMVSNWPFFSTLFKNLHVALGRADMEIAALYAELGTEETRAIYEVIKAEFELTCREVLLVSQTENILDTEPWLQRSIQVRNPYVDPLNYIQVALLRRIREIDESDTTIKDELTKVLAATVNGIAAGLQNVG